MYLIGLTLLLLYIVNKLVRPILYNSITTACITCVFNHLRRN